MNVNNVSSSAAAQQNARTPKNQLGKETFLSLLAAQLQYQDPLSAADNTQYIAQMAQFSSLEQMQNLNRSISDLIYFQYLQFGSQLVGKNLVLNVDGQRIEGRAEKVTMHNGEINVVVNGRPYSVHYVEEIGLAGEGE
jgi:flagellar basal-body rod modification protein FlgD